MTGLRTLAAFCVLLASPWALAQDAGSSLLKERMDGRTFQAAGLDQQTPEQLRVLEEWIIAHAAQIAAAKPASDAASATEAVAGTSAKRNWFGLGGSDDEKKDVPDTTVVSRVVGTFTGWRGRSVIALENGQKWRINDDSTLYVRKPLERPTATVSPGMLGAWNLKIEGYNTSARVVPAN